MFSNTTTREAEAAPARPPEEAQPGQLYLMVTCSGESQLIPFSSQAALTLGRSEAATVRLSDPGLSRLHAQFLRDGDAVIVTDLGSRNGTIVSGKRVTEATLRAGDTAVLGNVTVTVQAAPCARAAVLGLASYADILKRLDEEWTRSRSFRRPFTVLLIRSLGRHPVESFVGECTSRLNAPDIAGVYDPHTVIVLLPEVAGAAASETAQRIVAAAPSRTRLVCGLSAYPEAGFTPEQLISAAGGAVLRATDIQPVAMAETVPHVRPSQQTDVVRRSRAMLDVQRLIERVAPGTISVLIQGETGTGKEIVARELHEKSARRLAPLKVVNCATIPENLVESVLFGHVRGAFTGADRAHQGVFEQATSGTVFLDEVGELSASAQAALLRTLDTRRICPVGGTREIEVDARVVAATHRDLASMVAAGTFRLDLFHRLNAFTIELPPLRERRDEIRALVEHFVDRFVVREGALRARMSPDAMALLEQYSWPGNVRELRNVVERSLALADGEWITPSELPPHIRRDDPAAARSLTSPAMRAPVFPEGGIDLRAEVHSHEVALIQRALEFTKGHQRRAAELLNLPLRTFERKLQKLGMHVVKQH